MKITIITVGKNHAKQLLPLFSDYEQRVRSYAGALNWVFIPSSDVSRESIQILKRATGTIVLLDEAGQLISTPNLAEKIETYQNNSVKELTFIIGGAYGVNESITAKADFVWALSPLVFPHQLVRVILIEQLYRAYDILAGGKYHHG